MYTASRGNDYFGFTIILDCTQGLIKQLSPVGRLRGEGARYCAGGWGGCSARTAAGFFCSLLPH